MNILRRSIKWVMLISGVLTCTMVYATFAPEASLRSTFGEVIDGALAQIVVRNWGALIGLVGLMLIYGAFNEPTRRMALLVAGASKVVFISLVLRFQWHMVMTAMREFTWSAMQKKAARAAFDLALSRELRSIRNEAQSMLQKDSDDNIVWSLHDYLSEKRRDIAQKYDYRYSVLMLVFHRLVFEGWLTEEELTGIGMEKVEVIRKVRSLRTEASEP